MSRILVINPNSSVDVTRALERALDPLRFEAMNNLGILRAMGGAYQEAIRLYRQALATQARLCPGPHQPWRREINVEKIFRLAE